jgi:phospholipase C
MASLPWECRCPAGDVKTADPRTLVLQNCDNMDERGGVSRREFFSTTAAVASALALPGCRSGGQSAGALPDPEDSGIDHVVVVMMENRSFDHFLGWVPRADGNQAGTRLADLEGNLHESYDLAPNFQNCRFADPDHSYEGGRREINGGAMDGFLLTQPVGDTFPIGYYTADSLPFFVGCAEHWTICDRYFSGILSSTTPNRIYMHAGQTDRLSNTVDISTLPTIWDRMLANGHSVAYYYVDVPYTAFWGDKYLGFSRNFSKPDLAADIAAGKLANLTFIDNVGTDLEEMFGLSRDDHPVSDIRDGQAFLNEVYDAVRNGPQWDRTLLVINYDEWGGFYDHVSPPLAPVSEAEAAVGNDGRLGCRVPCVIIGPRARRGHVEHMQFEPNSILNLLAWRFGFEPLGARGNSNNLALALDFDSPPKLDTPAFDVPSGRFGGLCMPLQALAEAAGIPPPTAPMDIEPLPLPLQIQLPPIPGQDVPESLRRLLDHEQELDDLRELARGFGL